MNEYMNGGTYQNQNQYNSSNQHSDAYNDFKQQFVLQQQDN